MGIDKSLGNTFPTVQLHGSTFHYGKSPDGDGYLVEHSVDAKVYALFETEQEMHDFLDNMRHSTPRLIDGMWHFELDKSKQDRHESHQ